MVNGHRVFLAGSSFTRAFRNFLILSALVGIAASGYSMGAAVAIQFLVMIVDTCLGLLMIWKNPAATLQIVSRVLAGYAALSIATALCNAPEIMKWQGDVRALQAGTVYFFILGAVELSGLHLQVIPRNRVKIWNWLYGWVGKSYP